MKKAIGIGILALLGALLGAAGLAAGAGEPPSALGVARLGSLRVTSRVLVHPTSVDLRGVWEDAAVPCDVSRRLAVKVRIFQTPYGRRGTVRTLAGAFLDANCAEGGPNVGFTVTARRLGYACPGGAWKPARYTFVITTTEPARGLLATASLGWVKAGRC